jgi:hypothetical protein
LKVKTSGSITDLRRVTTIDFPSLRSISYAMEWQ